MEQGFTSRATMNEKKGEIYMSGIMRNGKGGLGKEGGEGGKGGEREKGNGKLFFIQGYFSYSYFLIFFSCRT